MFERVPQPVTPPTPSLPPSSQGKPKPFSQPLKQPPTGPIPLADQATMELFKRTSLSTPQKLLIGGIALVVIAALIGVGIWLFMELDPFSASNRGPVNTTTNNANAATDVPLQELDSDKDGIRDIDEKRYGTSAQLSDTDADGLTDYAEINQYHTKPTVADTDGDGFNDKAELDNGYDPNGPGRLAS